MMTAIMKRVGILTRGLGKTTRNQMSKFKKGDFVRIIETTHDSRIPPSRMGHLVERLSATVHYTDTKPVRTNVWRVYMTNGQQLKFHEMYLEHVK